MKKGIMELVDLIIVTKADGDLMAEVRRLQTEWSSALRLMRRRSPNWTPKVTFDLSALLTNRLLFPLGSLCVRTNEHRHR